MQKVIVYIFISLIASNSSFFQQFYKLPVLVEHFREHQEISNMGFVDYLVMHYWDVNHKDNDGDRDMQLPFKDVSGSSFHLVFIPTDKPQISIVSIINLPQSRIISYKSNLYTNPDLFSLFRPPVA